MWNKSLHYCCQFWKLRPWARVDVARPRHLIRARIIQVKRHNTENPDITMKVHFDTWAVDQTQGLTLLNVRGNWDNIEKEKDQVLKKITKQPEPPMASEIYTRFHTRWFRSIQIWEERTRYGGSRISLTSSTVPIDPMTVNSKGPQITGLCLEASSYDNNDSNFSCKSREFISRTSCFNTY